ncbi:MAG: site-specific integrase [Bacteroidetes bacterium]|nr:site-specific integrase [Bacteroidota bacterium]
MSKVKLPKGLFARGNRIWFQAYNPLLGFTENKSSGLSLNRENIQAAKNKRQDYINSVNNIEIVPEWKFLRLDDAKELYKKKHELHGDHHHIDFAVKIVKQEIGNKLVQSYKLQDSDDFIFWMKNNGKEGEGYSPNTISDYSKAMNSLFKFLRDRGYVDNIPFETVAGVKYAPKAIPMDDIAELFDYLLKRFVVKNYKTKEPTKQIRTPNYNGYRFLKTLLLTGLRTGEAIALRWEHIDFENNIITVVGNDGLGPKHRSEPDRLPILEEAKEHFLSFMQGTKPDDKVHPYLNKSPHFYKRTQMKLWEEHRYTFHQFRKTFITNLVKSGLHPTQAMMYARHKNYQTTLDFYNEKQLEEAVVIGNEKIAKFGPQLQKASQKKSPKNVI